MVMILKLLKTVGLGNDGYSGIFADLKVICKLLICVNVVQE
jgi:hypothetical protein